LVATYMPSSPICAAVSVISCLIGSLSLIKFRSRSAFIRAGIQISLIVFVLGFFVCLSSDKLISADSLAILSCSLLSGIICAFLAAGFAPIVEHLGGYITDMRLIEMATIDHPLLKDLSVQAPGTWNHSMVMGMMVEAAADATGANPVLARVGSYFHDIGKLKKPLYYVENSVPGENRHDKLSPSMSALIIRSHVKEGVELAEQHKLPQAIIDMIPQHHGTARIEYFYDKARKEAEEAGEDPDLVDESLYRYPGPKPQSREAGILMLADGIEASSRTLSEPTFDRIQGLVQKFINKVFASGELNECDLTLRDLHVIAKSFTRVLSGIYHQRIAYAEPAEKIKAQEAKAADSSEEQAAANQKENSKENSLESGSSNKKGREAASSSVSGADPAKSKEDLKRLGITHH
jgi:cyclic-di-AMP phosphodiesterase PgpH